MSSALPLVTIVICTRNRAARLDRVLAALSNIRSSHEWEVLFVDNASTDATAAVLEDAAKGHSSIRCMRVHRIGLGAGREAAWKEARGEIIAFTDDDCYVAPDFVDALVEVFREHPQVGVVGGRILLFDTADARVTLDERDAPVDIAARGFLPAGSLHGANLAFRREVLAKAGGFDPGLGAGTPFPCEDIDAAAAASWAGFPLRFDPRPVVFHHHGRREADVPKLVLQYNAGGGAYYAKYLLRPDSRSAYLRGWWRYALRSTPGKLPWRMRELKGAARYLAAQKRYGFLFVAVPFGLAAYGVLGAMRVWHAVRRRMPLAARRSPA